MEKKTEALRFNILASISNLDLAGFILQEAKNFLNNLSYYKLLNVSRNIEYFKDYLLNIDNENNQEIEKILF